MSMALFSPSPPSHLPGVSYKLSSRTTHFSQKSCLSLISKRNPCLLSARALDNGAGLVGSAATVEEEKVEKEEVSPAKPEKKLQIEEVSVGSNGAASSVAKAVPRFQDPRWLGGTWDLKQFQKDGKTNWDAVIDAEVRRRKWLEENPESSNNDDPVVFDTSIIPWWAWMKRFHLPEAELLNGSQDGEEDWWGA
uniref:Uncharacterized protein n=1 Tax=Nelumbo nucifera TaxID=4432 RepID=A0A822XH09_NELNU|nr:TPA_asm: hypothetical protein HUJ06_019782 [Nelumbo nucifera]